jgi:hypothetical protein
MFCAFLPPVDLLSFDIEISDVFDLQPGEDLDRHAPFHVSVASTVRDRGEEYLWYSTEADGTPTVEMSRRRARDLLVYLDRATREGCRVCAWNGLGFDLRWIGHAAGDPALAAEVALRSYDPMFQFFNQRGFPVSLAAVGRAMGVEQTKLMDGADAPKEWRAGNHHRVMEYVLGDSQITNAIVRAIEDAGEVRWVTKRGTTAREPMPELKPVADVLAEPEPDQSWMDEPMPRGKFVRWMPG